MKIDSTLINRLVTETITRFNTIKKVFESIETPEHYDAFRNMCETHLVFCNTWIDRTKPKVQFIQRKQTKLYNRLYNAAKYTIDEINGMIGQYDAMIERQAEEMRILGQIETRCRLEHQIAIEYQEKQLNKAKKEDKKKKPIGFVTSKPKKQRKKKDE